uniref:Uncharacterized protein n=1 Tax=Anguilla anguilla TaxID=7936 RepID=A0A0E9PGN0_ANGAN
MSATPLSAWKQKSASNLLLYMERVSSVSGRFCVWVLSFVSLYRPHSRKFLFEYALLAQPFKVKHCCRSNK